MERRLLLAFGLSLLVLLLWPQIFPPPEPPPQPPEEPAPLEQPATEDLRPAAEAAEAAEPGDTTADEPLYESVAAAAAREIEYEDDRFLVRFTNRGARVVSWRLKEYGDQNGGEELELVPRYQMETQAFPLAVRLDDPSLTEQINQALFEVSRVPRAGGERIEFRWSDGRGLEVRKALEFTDGEWLIGLELEVIDRGRTLPAGLVWGPGFGAAAGGSGWTNYYYHAALWNRQGTVRHVRNNKVEAGRQTARHRWAGLEDQYFAALLVPGDVDSTITLTTEELTPAIAEGQPGEEDEAPPPVPVPSIAVSIPAEGARLFVGPKKYTMLRELGYELEQAVWFSSNGLLAAVSKFVFLCLLWIYDHTIRNYGMAIILTTFILRVLLFPLNQYSMVSIKKSQMEMQRLQPKVNAIRNRFKKQKDAESRRKMNEELMAMYKKEGVNPMGGLTGCLPLLAQFPILIGFYNMLTVAVELRGAPFFGWIQDLSLKDPYLITPLLMGATMVLQQRMAATKMTDPMQRQQQRIMMLMPVFFTYICIQMPSGLVLYWFVNNVLGIGQQWLVNRKTGRLEAAAEKKVDGSRKRVRRSDAAGGPG